MNFYDLGLSEKTIKAIDEFGIKEPTTVQSDVIPSILQGKDVFTIAPGGCGKTTSYVFPLIDIISRKKPNDNILIITPDSEQAVVASDRLAIFNKYHEINEATIKNKDEEISDEANVIIGSPDLLVDLVEENKIDLSNVTILVVDDINLIKKNFNPALELQGVVLTMYDRRNNLSQMVEDDVRSFFGKKVYNTVIPRNVRISEAPSHGKPVLLYDFKCPGSQAYISLTGEVLKREKEIAA